MLKKITATYFYSISDNLEPWTEAELTLKLQDLDDAERGVFASEDIPAGILVTRYPHEKEMSVHKWNQVPEESSLFKESEPYVLEVRKEKRTMMDPRTGQSATLNKGHYVLYASAQTDVPPFGHFLNHCKTHPNIQVSFFYAINLNKYLHS